MKHCVSALFSVQNGLEDISPECVCVRQNELNKLEAT